MPGIKGLLDRDRFLFKITLTSSKTLRIIEASVTRNCTIAAGSYYLHTSVNATYPGLYAALVTAINAACADDFGLFACTPSLSTGALGGGLELRQITGAPVAWHIDWAGTTLDPRILGFGAGVTGTSAPVGTSLRSPFTRWGDWIPTRYATSKDRDQVRTIRASTGIVESLHFEQSDYGTRIFRDFEYRLQPAAAVIDVQDAVYQEVAGFDASERNAAFEILFSEGLSKRIAVLVVHDVGDLDLSLPDGQWEAVFLREDQQAKSLRACVKKANVGGERYTVAFSTAVGLGGGYGY